MTSPALSLSLQQLSAKSRTAKPLDLQGKERCGDLVSSRKVLFVCTGLRSWTASKGLHWLCAPKAILIYCVEGFITKDHHLSEEIVKHKSQIMSNPFKNRQKHTVQCIGISATACVAAKALHQRHPRLEVFQRTRSMHIWLPGREWLADGAQTHHGTLNSLNDVWQWGTVLAMRYRQSESQDTKGRSEKKTNTEPRMLGPGKKNLSSERLFQ